MRNRIIVFTLCVALLLSFAIPAYADETTAQLSISTAEEFLIFAENCRLDSYSQGLTVTLENSIDLEGFDFNPIPIFSGSFDGSGHTISGVSVESDGSVQGLFRYLTATAVVQNLIISGDIHPGGSRSNIGAIAGHNQGHIRYCGFTGNVSGSKYVGGIVGINGVTGIVENCLVKGTIHGDHFVGGIAGENAGVIRSCTNEALINTTPQQNSVDISDITMDTLTNTEAPNTVTDIGGITGISSGVIRSCKNLGDVGYQHMGYNIGGICGTQSGYVVDCENHGSVQGRKEVGGIVGQMEPNTLIEYSEDTLQTLQLQLGELSGLVNKASGNVQANASQIGGQIGVLQDQTQAAQGAVDALIPDASNPLPDPDSTLAAFNTLSSNLNAMPGTLSSITAATKTTVNSLSRDLTSISGQIGKMEQTLNSANENLGGSIVDVSDLDTVENLTGKVENCVNFGSVLADLNAGGIAGAIALENDLDILEDWQENGEESLNFESQLRAVILNCKNNAVVSGKKQNAGGIVGWQSLGLVKNSTNTGMLNCPNADYVGGISGLSTGYLRQNFVKCEIVASNYVGGIAGSGTIVTDCFSQVKLVDCREKVGAVLGTTGSTQEENPISGNYFLVVGQDPGAIDGIHYLGLAESVSLEEFMQLENLPEIFHTVTIRFVFPDGKVTDVALAPGSALDPAQIPTLPVQNGVMGVWDGLEAAQLDSILFDLSFNAVYATRPTVIQSEETRENGLPILLLEGSFAENTTVHIAVSGKSPALADKEALLEVWEFTADEGATQARFLLPAGMDSAKLKLMVCNTTGDWKETSCTQDGSYLVFPIMVGVQCIALIEVPAGISSWIIAAGILVVLLPIPIVIAVKRKRAKSTPKTTA